MAVNGPRPAHMSLGLICLVAAGGAAGSLARYGVETAVGAVDGWPVATMIANLTGAFLLGFLLEALAGRGVETAGRRRVRLALGTGVLGGYTTFSTLAVEVERLAAGGRWGIGLAYGLVSVVLGVALAFAGGQIARLATGHTGETSGESAR